MAHYRGCNTPRARVPASYCRHLHPSCLARTAPLCDKGQREPLPQGSSVSTPAYCTLGGSMARHTKSHIKSCCIHMHAARHLADYVMCASAATQQKQAKARRRKSSNNSVVTRHTQYVYCERGTCPAVTTQKAMLYGLVRPHSSHRMNTGMHTSTHAASLPFCLASPALPPPHPAPLSIKAHR